MKTILWTQFYKVPSNTTCQRNKPANYRRIGSPINELRTEYSVGISGSLNQHVLVNLFIKSTYLSSQIHNFLNQLLSSDTWENIAKKFVHHFACLSQCVWQQHQCFRTVVDTEGSQRRDFLTWRHFFDQRNLEDQFNYNREIETFSELTWKSSI